MIPPDGNTDNTNGANLPANPVNIKLSGQTCLIINGWVRMVKTKILVTIGAIALGGGLFLGGYFTLGRVSRAASCLTPVENTLTSIVLHHILYHIEAERGVKCLKL